VYVYGRYAVTIYIMCTGFHPFPFRKKDGEAMRVSECWAMISGGLVERVHFQQERVAHLHQFEDLMRKVMQIHSIRTVPYSHSILDAEGNAAHHTLIHSYTHTLLHSYTHALIHSCTPTLLHSYTLLLDALKVMQLDRKKRWTCAQVLSHPFLQPKKSRYIGDQVHLTPKVLPSRMMANLKNFTKYKEAEVYIGTSHHTLIHSCTHTLLHSYTCTHTLLHSYTPALLHSCMNTALLHSCTHTYIHT
jgi:serine/threonine protein kinase